MTILWVFVLIRRGNRPEPIGLSFPSARAVGVRRHTRVSSARERHGDFAVAKGVIIGQERGGALHAC